MESHLPLVSIVTPSLNQGRFLRATIESVLGQDYPALEYWVIDGGSRDDSEQVLREFAHDRRFHYVIEPDEGQSDAINKGWRRSTGKILAWLNSDDIYYPGAIRRQVGALLANPDAGLVYGDVDYTDTNGQFLGRCHARPFDPRRFLHVQMIPQPSLFMRRELIERFGGLDPTLHYMMDYEFLLRVMRHTRFHYNRERVATYRLHSESKTEARGQEMVDEALEILERHCRADPRSRSDRRAALSDWQWMGAIRAIEAGDRSVFLSRSFAALRLHPLRRRMAMVALRAADSALGTSIFERAVLALDRLAAARSVFKG